MLFEGGEIRPNFAGMGFALLPPQLLPGSSWGQNFRSYKMIRTIAAALAAFVLVAFSAVAAEETKSTTTETKMDTKADSKPDSAKKAKKSKKAKKAKKSTTESSSTTTTPPAK
jgi:hypothetical protein